MKDRRLRLMLLEHDEYIKMHLLKTNEMIDIPVRHIPVRNLMMANIRNEVDKALSTAKVMVDK